MRDCNVSCAIHSRVFLSVCPVWPVSVYPDSWLLDIPWIILWPAVYDSSLDYRLRFPGFRYHAPSLIPDNELYSVTTTTLWIALVIPVRLDHSPFPRLCITNWLSCDITVCWRSTLTCLFCDSTNKASSKELFLVAFVSSNPPSRQISQNTLSTQQRSLLGRKILFNLIKVYLYRAFYKNKIVTKQLYIGPWPKTPSEQAQGDSGKEKLPH